MKIGLARFQYHHTGGAERTLGLLARGLLERGHQVHAVCARWSGDEITGLKMHLAAAPAGRGFASAALATLQGLGLDTFLSLERIPHSPLVRAGDGCHAAWLKRRAPHENVFKRLSFSLNPKHRETLALEREMFTSPALAQVIANSKLVAGELGEYYGLTADKISVIYNGVDHEALSAAQDPQVRKSAREQLGLGKNEATFLFLGSGFERKGLAYAIRALARLERGRLLVAGRDRARPYQRLAAGLGVADRVSFLGPRRDVERLLAAADCLLLPTIYDPCANSCLEALSAGVPVVTTGANGASELVEPGASGFVCSDPRDAGGLAEALERALSLKGPFAHQVPSLGEWLERVVSLLEETAGKRGA